MLSYIPWTESKYLLIFYFILLNSLLLHLDCKGLVCMVGLNRKLLLSSARVLSSISINMVVKTCYWFFPKAFSSSAVQQWFKLAYWFLSKSAYYLLFWVIISLVCLLFFHQSLVADLHTPVIGGKWNSLFNWNSLSTSV